MLLNIQHRVHSMDVIFPIIMSSGMKSELVLKGLRIEPNFLWWYLLALRFRGAIFFFNSDVNFLEKQCSRSIKRSFQRKIKIKGYGTAPWRGLHSLPSSCPPPAAAHRQAYPCNVSQRVPTASKVHLFSHIVRMRAFYCILSVIINYS